MQDVCVVANQLQRVQIGAPTPREVVAEDRVCFCGSNLKTQTGVNRSNQLETLGCGHVWHRGCMQMLDRACHYAGTATECPVCNVKLNTKDVESLKGVDMSISGRKVAFMCIVAETHDGDATPPPSSNGPVVLLLRHKHNTWGFPGGQRDEADVDSTNNALREAAEEIIPRKRDATYKPTSLDMYNRLVGLEPSKELRWTLVHTPDEHASLVMLKIQSTDEFERAMDLVTASCNGAALTSREKADVRLTSETFGWTWVPLTDVMSNVSLQQDSVQSCTEPHTYQTLLYSHALDETFKLRPFTFLSLLCATKVYRNL